MAQNKAAGFEESLERLEQIVKLLESSDVTLEASVELFKEGRELAKHCESLLAVAQQTIESAAAGNGTGQGEKPAPPAGTGSLFDDDALA
jgi:exodeoxyribonuclease VII small subunit